MTTKTVSFAYGAGGWLPALAVCVWLGALPTAQAANPPIEIVDAWARATPPGVATGAAYCKIVNHGPADRLLGAHSPAARSVELHSTTRDERGVEAMAHAGEIAIAAGGTIELSPGGTHLMLVGIGGPLVADRSIEITLVFANAGEIEVEVPVVDARAAPPASHEHHAH
jgi:hypothetical protein